VFVHQLIGFGVVCAPIESAGVGLRRFAVVHFLIAGFHKQYMSFAIRRSHHWLRRLSQILSHIALVGRSLSHRWSVPSFGSLPVV